jgi:hypothetical protein
MSRRRRFSLPASLLAAATAFLLIAPVTASTAVAGGLSVSNTQVNQVFPGPFPKNKQNEPSLAQNPTTPLNLIAGSNDEIGLPACTDTTPSNCPFTPGISVSGFYASFDGGQTWPCQGLIDLSKFGEYAFGDPSQAFDSKGNAYYGTLAFPQPPTTDEAATGRQADFFVAKSTDGGCTYTSAAKVSGAAPSIFDDKDAITADSNPASPFHDNVYAAWTAFRAVGRGFGNDQIELSRSTDGGATFSHPSPLSPAYNNNSVGGRQGAVVKVGPDGTVYVSWFDTVNKTPVEMLTESHDGGVTFNHATPVATVNDDFLSPLPGTSFRQDARAFPSLAIGGDGSIYIEWAEHHNGHAIDRVASSHDGGLTFTTVTAGNVSGRSAFFGSVAVAPQGTVDVAFLAVDDLPTATAPGAGVAHYDAYLVRSTNGGATFGSPQLISTATSDPDGSSTNSLTAQFLGDYITTAADSSHVYAVWTDSRNATPCTAVDAFRAGTAPKPDVITQCPTTFGNTDIILGTVS